MINYLLKHAFISTRMRPSRILNNGTCFILLCVPWSRCNCEMLDVVDFLANKKHIYIYDDNFYFLVCQVTSIHCFQSILKFWISTISQNNHRKCTVLFHPLIALVVEFYDVSFIVIWCFSKSPFAFGKVSIMKLIKSLKKL